MTGRSTVLPESEPRTVQAQIVALTVAGDQSVLDHLEQGLNGEDDLTVRTATTTASMLEQLDDVDCLVLAAATLAAVSADVVGETDVNGDGTTDSAAAVDAPGAGDSDSTAEPGDGRTPTAAVLDRIGQHVPELPIVVVTDPADSGPGRPFDHETTAVDIGSAGRWIDFVAQPVRGASGPGIERLAHRIRALVERKRLAALSRRSLASIELAQDPIAIVGPDETIEYVNRWYAMQSGCDRADLSGRPWQACFPDETVAHLESTAIPTVADGWRWTGRCTAQRRSGATFPAHVRLGGLEDGSLVFVVDELEDDADDS